MSQENYKYVVLGGGYAAGYIARSFAALGCQGMLRIISEEKTLPYDRSELSKGMFKQECREIFTEAQDEEWYRSQRFDVRLNTRVKSVNLDQKMLYTSAGDFSFDKLIIATGSTLHTVRIAGANFGEVHCLRWFDDRQTIVDAITTAKSIDKTQARAIVIGSNYIAMEIAASIAEAGIEAWMVLEADQFIPDLMPKHLSEQFEQLFESRKIRLIKDVKVDEMLPRRDADDMVGFVRLSNGEELQCSFCVLVPSTKPRIELFRKQLTIDQHSRGILVDSHLRTSHRDVYAVGDVCAFPQLYDDKPGRWPRADHAVRSAHYAPYSVLADELNRADQLEDYWYLPHTSSVVFRRSWDFLGRPLGDCYYIGSLFDEQCGFATVYVGFDMRIEGLFFQNGTRDDLLLLRSIAKQRPVLTQDQLGRLRSLTSARSLLQFLREFEHPQLVELAVGSDWAAKDVVQPTLGPDAEKLERREETPTNRPIVESQL